MTNLDALNTITGIANTLGKDVQNVWTDLHTDPRFILWSGSDSPLKHHYGKGKLAIHTAEVMKMGFASVATLELMLDPKEWFFASLFHDVGKMYDYSPVENTDYQEWTGTEHKRRIHHISRSAIYWSHAIAKYPTLNANYHDQVLHAILAHHGQREWGSPVAPKSRVAWLLHLCDGISARMDDCEKVDYLKLRDKK